jgi:hypothetical protein
VTNVSWRDAPKRHRERREGELAVEHSKQKITTFLMFDGKAEEAMQYYVSVFDTIGL